MVAWACGLGLLAFLGGCVCWLGFRVAFVVLGLCGVRRFQFTGIWFLELVVVLSLLSCCGVRDSFPGCSWFACGLELCLELL